MGRKKSTKAKRKLWCVVPGCSSDSRKKHNLEKYPWMKNITFEPFPTKLKNSRLRAQWLSQIRRPNEYKPQPWHRVCSRHFWGGIKTEENSVPVLFPWNNYRQSKNPRSTSSIEKRNVNDDDDDETDEENMMVTSDMEQSINVSSSVYSNEDFIEQSQLPPVVTEITVQTSNEELSCSSDKDINITNTKLKNGYFAEEYAYSRASLINKEHSHMPFENFTTDTGTQTELSGVDIDEIQSNIKCLEDRLDDKDTLLRDIFIEKVTKSDKSIKKYTGLPNLEIFNSIVEIGNEHASNLKYWTGRDSANEKRYQFNGEKPGPKRKLTTFQEIIIMLVRLRTALPLFVLSDLFGVSMSRVSSIFTTWIFLFYFIFKDLIIWPSKKLVQKHMPRGFKKSFPKTRAIIDCSEIFIQRPRNPSVHAKTYSSYKNHNTFKFLVSITPTGAFNFISDLWGGNTSDRYITANCGFLDLVSPGDEIMADRGFTIRDLLTERKAYLAIPPFTRKCNWGKGKRLNASEIRRTRKIANLRIHVERAIQRLKNFSLISRIIPWSMKSLVNPMIAVAAFFCNMMRPLVKK